jgi:GT2 family glycosyltransferase
MERYLKMFLDWLPRQTYFDRLEVVLDHNEPTAQEVQWVRAFQERYPGKLKHIVVEKVDPIGTSMNRCIREARADLVTIWNVDDLRTPDSIETEARVLLDHSDIGLTYGSFTVVNAFGRTEGRAVDCSRYAPEDLTRSMFGGPYFMFRKNLCEKAGLFDEQLKQGPDFDLQVRLAFHGKARAAEGSLGYYLDEGRGLSTRPDTLQPVERTAIELRYGIYDKIDYRLAARAARYNIPFLLYQNQWLPIAQFVPNYEALLQDRYRKWHAKGIQRFRYRSWIEESPLWLAGKRVKKLFKKRPGHP